MAGVAAAGALAAPAAGAPAITGTDADIWNAASPSVTYVITSGIRNGEIRWTLDGPDDDGGPGPGGAPDSGRGRSPLAVSLPGLADGDYTLIAHDRVVDAARRTFVVDRTPPTIAIAQPGDGAVVDQGAALAAEFSCAGATTCTGTVADGEAIDTSRPGPATLRVDARDAAGNAVAAEVTYRVLAPGETLGGVQGDGRPRASRLVLPATVNAARLLPRRLGAVRTTLPLLRWPRRAGARLYNVQVFLLRAGRPPVKVASLFPRANRVRVPPGRLATGRRYAWRVWPFLRAGYTRSPLGLSIFSVDVRRR